MTSFPLTARRCSSRLKVLEGFNANINTKILKHFLNAIIRSQQILRVHRFFYGFDRLIIRFVRFKITDKSKHLLGAVVW